MSACACGKKNSRNASKYSSRISFHGLSKSAIRVVRRGSTLQCRRRRCLQRTRYELADQLTAVGVVDTDHTVETGRGDLFSVRPKRDGIHRPALALKLGDLLTIPGIEDSHFTLSIAAGADDDAAAILVVAHVEDAARHTGERADQVEVVADLSVLRAVHLIDLRHAVRAADEQLVLRRMAVDGLQSALERPGCDARDVVH